MPGNIAKPTNNNETSENRLDFYLNNIEPLENRLKAHLHYLKDNWAAEDIAQDALLAAWEKLDQLESKENASSWLFSIADNKAKNFFRHHSNMVVEEDISKYLQKRVPSAESQYIEALHVQFLEHSIEIITQEQSKVLILFVLGYKPSEIANILNISSRAVSARLYRARKAVSKLYALLYEE